MKFVDRGVSKGNPMTTGMISSECDVKLVRWPAERERRERYRVLGIPTLLVVEGGCEPPQCTHSIEDWVRAPVSRADVKARVSALQARAWATRVPEVDPIGVVRYDGRSTSVSPTEADLLACLARQFGEVVGRDDLVECLPERSAGCRRNALDLHIMRIRRRLRPLNLIIRTVWGHGYLLEAAR